MFIEVPQLAKLLVSECNAYIPVYMYISDV